jgi:hypothetical protein
MALLTQLPQLFLCLVIGLFPEFVKSKEHELWLQHEQLLIDTAEFNDLSLLLSPPKTRGSRRDPRDGFEYLHRIQCFDFIPLLNRPQWILALARSFDHLPFPICIHSATPPHLFLYANECFLASGDYLSHREDLFRTSIDFLLANPFELPVTSSGAGAGIGRGGRSGSVSGGMDSFPDLSYLQQYQHSVDYQIILEQTRQSLKVGSPSRNLLKISTPSGKAIYDLMTLLPVTNLYGEYICMISVHCNYQSLLLLSSHSPHTSLSTPSKRSHRSPHRPHSSHQEDEEDTGDGGGGPFSSSLFPSPFSTFDMKLGPEQIQHLVLLDDFIHCLPYRIHHTRVDNYILVNTYLDEWRAASVHHDEEESRSGRERSESRVSMRMRSSDSVA